MASNSKTVLMLSPPVGDVLPRMLTGTLRVADERRWDFYPVTCNRNAQRQLFFERSPGGGTLEELLGMLRPDGVIVALNVVSPTEFQAAAQTAGLGRHLPVVHLGESLSRPYVFCSELERLPAAYAPYFLDGEFTQYGGNRLHVVEHDDAVAFLG